MFEILFYGVEIKKSELRGEKDTNKNNQKGQQFQY